MLAGTVAPVLATVVTTVPAGVPADAPAKEMPVDADAVLCVDALHQLESGPDEVPPTNDNFV